MYIRVKAFPDAKKEHVEVDGERLRIFVREPAQDNRANKRIAELVAQYHGIPVDAVRLISGHHGPNKLFSIYKNPGM